MNKRDDDDELYNWASAPDNSMMPISDNSSMPIPSASSMPMPSASSMPMPSASSMPIPSASSMPIPSASSTTESPLINYNSISAMEPSTELAFKGTSFSTNSESPLLDLNFQQDSTNNYQALNDIFTVNNNNNNNSNISNNEIDDMLNRLRIRTNELNGLVSNINQDQIENLREDLDSSLQRLTQTAGNERQAVEALSMLGTVTELYVKYFENKNKIKSVLSNYYANLCAIGTYLNPDVNRVIATIEAGISLSLMTNQVFPFMRPFSSATQVFSTLTIAALVADMTYRYNNAGCRLYGSVTNAVQPLIDNVVPLCKVVANSACSTATKFMQNTRTGRAIRRRGNKALKTLKQVRENVRQRKEAANRAFSESISSLSSSADKALRGTVRAVTQPIQTISNAISFCRGALTGLSRNECSVVNANISPSSSSSSSSSSSVSSLVREELLDENPLIMSNRELRVRVNELLEEVEYLEEADDEYSTEKSPSREIGNKYKNNSSYGSNKRRKLGGKKTRRH